MLKVDENDNNRILVVDDNEAIHDDFRKILANDDADGELEDLEASLFGDENSGSAQSMGAKFELTFASQGAEGFQKAQQAVEAGTPFAVAFVDMRMPPGWDGLKTIEHIWKVDPNIQVVICTAFADYSWGEIIERLGRTDQLLILKKPFDNVEVSQLAISLTRKWTLARFAEMQREQLESMVQSRTREIQAARDELVAANRIKSEFLANMSHEIRTPMNGILGFVDILVDDDGLSEEHRESIEFIKHSADNLMGIIDQILDLSKVENHTLALDNIDFDLELMLFDVCDIIKKRFTESPVEFIVDIENIPSTVSGDPTRVRQILMNLVDNAAKFTAEGHIVLRTCVEEEREDSIAIQFAVEDTGIGIPEDQQAVIFESFRQADGSTTRKFGGTGLGLAISKRLVEQMGGQMWVDSTVGEGSMFCFQISLNKAQHTPYSGQPIRLAELEGRTALLIDDNRVALSITTRTLTEWGMQVVSFHSVAEALGYLAKTEQKPEVALIDMMRPDLEAPEAMRQFTSHPSLTGINLIVLTSEASPGSARLCQNIGFKGYLPKPVPRGAIRDVLCTILGVENSTQPKAIITRHSAREELFKNKQILLLDTNPETETESLKLLSQLGTKVTPTHHLDAALEELSNGSFDLILLGLDGFSGKSLDAMLTLMKTNGSIPVVGLTENTQSAETLSCLKAGMSDTISLPVNKEALVRVIGKWCSE